MGFFVIIGIELDLDKMKLGFEDANLHKGKILCKATEINFSYNDQKLWSDDLSFQVNSGDRIALKPVVISRDLGRVVEIGTGLTPDDRVVESPPDGIADGDRVRIVGGATNGETKSAKDGAMKPNG